MSRPQIDDPKAELVLDDYQRFRGVSQGKAAGELFLHCVAPWLLGDLQATVAYAIMCVRSERGYAPEVVLEKV